MQSYEELEYEVFMILSGSYLGFEYSFCFMQMP